MRLSVPNAAQLCFALGRAFEQRQRYPDAFAHYARGNSLRRLDAPFDIEHFERRTARIRAFFNEHSSPSTPAAEIRAQRRSSLSVCRAPVPHWSSRSSPAIRASKAPWSCQISSPSRTSLMTWSQVAMAIPKPWALRPLHCLSALGSRYLEETAAAALRT